MNGQKTLTFVLLLYLMLAPHELYARSLKKSISAALLNNPSFQASKEGYRGVRAAQYIALSEFFPRINLFATNERVKNAIVDSNTDALGVSATIDLFTSGVKLNNYLKNKSGVEGEKYLLKQKKQNLLLSTVEAHMSVIRHHSTLNLLQKSFLSVEKELQIVQSQFEIGLTTKVNVANAQSYLKKSEALMIRQIAQLEEAKAVYQEIVGEVPVNLTHPKKDDVLLPETLENTMSYAYHHSPLIMVAKIEVKKLKYQSRAIIGKSLPQVTLSANYISRDQGSEFLRQTREDQSIAIKTSMPIFQGGKAIFSYKSSKHLENQKKMQLHATLNMVERMTRVAWYQYIAAKIQNQASKKQIEAETLTLEMTKQEQKLGQRTTLDVLNAENALLQAEVSLVEAEYEKVVSKYTLMNAIGWLKEKSKFPNT